MSKERIRGRGPITWMVKNPVAANLLMIVLLLAGLGGILTAKQEVLPEFDVDIVTVSVPYPGGTPEDVEQGIVLAVEEAVRGLDGVKRVTSSAAAGLATVNVELLLDAEPDLVLSDVKNEVDRITSFPEEAEEPRVFIASLRREVISLVLAGDQDLRTLHDLAEQVRSDLLAMDTITQVELGGIRPLEVSIEVPRATLEAYGLSLDDIAQQVTRGSVELPGGEVETRKGEVLVRVDDRRRFGHEFDDLIIKSTASGASVRLGDIARITDGYEDTDQASYYLGQPAVRITAYRVGDQTPLEISRAVRAYAEELKNRLPRNITVATWSDDSEILRARMQLLGKNAAIGLALVLLVLALFLEVRLAAWVAVGIPISFLGAFLVMPAADVSVNMITLFAFIVTLGIVVDDAIVIGENIYNKIREGVPRVRAAIAGTHELLGPVTFAVLTTVAAFAPMLFVPGTTGKFFGLIPVVVISVLLLSLIEAFFILPAHLAHGGRIHGKWIQRIDRISSTVERGLDWFRERPYRRALQFAIRQRYVVLAISMALLLIAASTVWHGLVPFSFFPRLEGDLVVASARLPYGVPVERTQRVRRQLEEAAYRAIEESGGQRILRGMFTRVGEGPLQSQNLRDTGGHLVTVELNLVPTEEREVSAAQFANQWKWQTPDLPGVESLAFYSGVGPPGGSEVAVQLSHPSVEVLAETSEQLAKALRGYPSLTNVINTYSAGKTQLDFRLLPQARTLGLTAQDLARQLRSSFFGAEAIREQRERNEVKVMVRLPEDERQSEYDLEALQIRTPTGGFVPFPSVAELERDRSPTAIRREDGQRTVDVTADLAFGVASPNQVLDDLTAAILPALQEEHPKLKWRLVGQQRELDESVNSLLRFYLLALLAIYALLAVPFRSYLQPLIIMAVIPFGFVGAIGGHILMGYGLSIISLMGLVALSGVVVNDSLVLIHSTNHYREQGQDPAQAVLAGGLRRLRPILLTSLTTFFGLTPMILETSVQARFLIPMAISLGFGVLFTTVVVLLLVPALYLIIEDLKRFARRMLSHAPQPTEPAAGTTGGR